jgi:molybdenum cofactor biosynthesis enzyme
MGDKIIQNKILLGLLREFEEDFGISDNDEAKSFERLVNYVVLSKIDPEAFSEPAVFDLIDVDKASTFGIDAFALIVNDNLITDKSEIELHRKSKRLEVRFVFIQTKRSTSVDSGALLKFTAAVRNVFSNKPLVPLSDELQVAKELIDEVFKTENARLLNKKPRCELYYATSGNAIKDAALLGVMESEEQNILAMIPEVQTVSIKHVDADFIIDSFSEIENRYSVLINFEKNVPCERIEDVEQAFIGYLPASEFLKLITGSDGNLRKNIFYENVRDFQGSENAVNTEISETLSDVAMLDKFILLNNGVTVVARSFSNIRSIQYEISDYYVVNGCQTSNMIYRFRDQVRDDLSLKVPVKFIHTTSSELITKLIRSTNRQTPVPDEAFVSLEKFHKRLQEFYRLYSSASPEALYYERRSKEFSSAEAKIEKPRIINLHAQIRSFTSIMLNEPQLVMSNNPVAILREHGGRLFVEDHKQTPYFLSSLLLYLFHRLSIEGAVDGKYVISRYWICWIARVLCSGKLDMGLMNSLGVEKDSEAIVARLASKDFVLRLFKDAIALFDKSRGEHFAKYGRVKNAELVRLRTFRDSIKEKLARTKMQKY